MFSTATVVAAIDDTLEAEETLRAARTMLAKDVPSVLHVLHVVEELPPAVQRYLFPYACLGDDHDAVVADILSASRGSLLERFGESTKLDERFLRVVYGRVIDAAMEELRRTGPDLVVVGSSSSEVPEPGLIGKNAARLIRRSPAPVLVVRGRRRESIQKIVVALDMGQDAPGLFSSAIIFAHTHGAQVTPVHVVSSLPAAASGRTRGADAGSRKELDRRFQQVLSSLKLPYPVQTVATDIVQKPRLEEGDVGEGIVAAARELEADMVVVYRCESSALSGARLGRVTEYVLRHSPCDVLVLPPPVRHESE